MRALLQNFRLNLGFKKLFVYNSVASAIIAAFHPRRLTLPTVSLASFIGDRVPEIPFRLLAMPPTTTGPDDVVPLCALARSAMPSRILEIGCHRGSTTVNLALASPGAKVVTYDIDPTAGQCIDDSEISVRTRIERRIVSFPTDEARLLAEPRYDFIYVDGDHSGPGAGADTALAMRIIAPGGIIAWHDYAHCGHEWLMGSNMVPEVLARYVPALPIRHLEGTRVAVVRMPAS